MTATEPTFTVIVPCHNYERFLTTSISSVLAQDRDDVEVIVVDDASTDNSAQVASSFGDPVRLIRLERNVGPGGAWGVGLSSARGRYVCKLDADDWQLPGFLDRVAGEFARDERIGLVATGVYLYRDGEATAVIQTPTDGSVVLDESTLRRRLLRKFFVRMPGTALRREAVRNRTPRTDLRMGEDWEYFLRVLRGWRASLVGDALAVYRIHRASLTLTSQSNDRLREQLERLLDVTRNTGDPGYLTNAERRIFGLGVAESYLGTVGPRLAARDAVSVARHFGTAAKLAASESPLAVPLLFRYLAWGSWQRLVVHRRREQYPIARLRPRRD